MKFNTLITGTTLTFFCIFNITCMEIDVRKPSKKQQKRALQEEEDRIIEQWTKTVESAWDNFDSSTRITLSPEIYYQIQNQFTRSPKELITLFPKTKLTEQDKQALVHLGKEKEIREKLNKKLEEYQKILLKNQELKDIIQKEEAKIAELKITQKKITAARKRARQKEKKQQAQIASKQKPVANTSSNKSKNEQFTAQQLANKKRFVALRTLFKKYAVQKEADLKNKFNDICWQINENYLDGRINDSCTFEYYSDTNELKIFTDDYEFETSDSDHDLEISVTMLPQ